MLLRFERMSLPLDAVRTSIVQARDKAGLGCGQAVQALQAGNLDFEGHQDAPTSIRRTP